MVWAAGAVPFSFPPFSPSILIERHARFALPSPSLTPSISRGVVADVTSDFRGAPRCSGELPTLRFFAQKKSGRKEIWRSYDHLTFIYRLSAIICPKKRSFSHKDLILRNWSFRFFRFREKYVHLFFVSGSVTVGIFLLTIIVSITGSVMVGIVFLLEMIVLMIIIHHICCNFDY